MSTVTHPFDHYSVEARFEFLAIATGVERVTEIILPEDGQLGDGIADPVVRLFEGFEAEKIL